KSKTYNSRDSPMVTHLTTSPPVSCLCKAERTGSPIFMILWSYVSELCLDVIYIEWCAQFWMEMVYFTLTWHGPWHPFADPKSRVRKLWYAREGC
ncbi:hypothetical protein K505DRAFT_235632, partial [Melanomma pulvis-pyrius CBS 109.77]